MQFIAKRNGNRRILASRDYEFGAPNTRKQLRDLLRCRSGVEISAVGRCGCTCAPGFGLHLVEGTTHSQANGSGTSDAIDGPGQEARLSGHQRDSPLAGTCARSPVVDYRWPFKL
jgi:hypothetical protein